MNTEQVSPQNLKPGDVVLGAGKQVKRTMKVLSLKTLLYVPVARR